MWSNSLAGYESSQSNGPMQYSKSLKIQVWCRKRKRKLVSMVNDFESFIADTFLGTHHCHKTSPDGLVIWSLYLLLIHQVISATITQIGLSEHELVTIAFHQIRQSIGVNRRSIAVLLLIWKPIATFDPIGGILVAYGGVWWYIVGILLVSCWYMLL